MVSGSAKFREIKQALAQAGAFDADFEAREIIREYTGRPLPLTGDISPDEEHAIDEAVRRRVSGEPLQYIFGKWEFYGLPFYVGKGVLIPRPETELLTDIAAERLNAGSTALDLFSGSGCIPVSIAKTTGAKCFAVELHDAAFGYLTRNIALNGAEEQVTALQADACDGTLFGDMKFDYISANPPYITGAEMRELPENVRHEPETALYGGTDGLDFYKAFIPAWAGRLTKGGAMAAETGETQGGAVSAIMRECGLEPSVIKDYAGLDRVVLGIR